VLPLLFLTNIPGCLNLEQNGVVLLKSQSDEKGVAILPFQKKEKNRLWSLKV